MKFRRLLGLALLGLALALLGADLAKAESAVTVLLAGVGGSNVSGAATLTPDGNGTQVGLKVSGLTPGSRAQVALHAGTCAMPSASAAQLPTLTADTNGNATAAGPVLFRGTENVSLATLTDGDHIIAVAGPNGVVACGVIRTTGPDHSDSPSGNLASSLLAEGAQRQVIQFNPAAALQKRIFADRFVPNSPEFSVTFNRLVYAAQRAEHLGSGAVRVYFVRVDDWGNVDFVQRGVGGHQLGDLLLAEAERQQVIQFNPNAALQKQIFAAGFVPNSPEFRLTQTGTTWAAQRAEHLGTGEVRVYHAAVGNWGNVRFVTRGSAGAANPGWATYASRVFPYALRYPTNWVRNVNYQPEPSGPAREIESITLQQPGYGTAGKFSTIDVWVSKGAPYWPRTECSRKVWIAGIEACHRYQEAGQNPAQEGLQFQWRDAYYDLRIVYADDQNRADFSELFNQVVSGFRFTD